MQSSKKKKAPSMEQCFYGKGCTRKDCFYRHDNPGPAGGGEKSAEPCMPFLAGQCTFAAGGCRKRHPPKAEATRLVAKYKQTKCRFGKDCKTDGCLYIHPGDAGDLGGTAAFPPLAGTNGAPRLTAPSGAWRPAQPTGATVAMASPGAPPMTTNQVPQQPAPADGNAALVKSAWQPSPPQQPAPVWGQGRNPVLAHHSSPPPPAMNGNAANGVAAQVTPNRQPPAAQKSPGLSFAAAASPPQPRNSDSALNINAKEFVPGNL